MNRFRRCAQLWVAMCLAACVFSVSAEAPSDRGGMITLDIKSQPIREALKEFARQSGLQVLFYSDVADGVSVPALAGTFTQDGALARLLAGTELTYSYVNARTVEIHRSVTNSSGGKTTSNKEANHHLLRLADVHLAEVPETEDSPQIGTAEDARGSDGNKRKRQRGTIIEEIIVTAQKREERLIDVPQSMSVLSADYLDKISALQFRDFANTVPGLSFTTVGAGNTQITLRGVTTGSDISPTVGIYVDEVPYGSSTSFASAAILALDVSLFDLSRIEVLRGPQGTLYGASTMGGLIKYVTKQPDATRSGFDVQAGMSSTHDGRISYNGGVAVNAPIIVGKVALRASSFYSRDGGYVDNLVSGEKDVNRSDIYGGRADLMLTPTEALTVRIAAFVQEISRDGQANADYSFAGMPLDRRLDQRRRFSEAFDQRFRVASGTVTYDLDWASLTSISSYQTVRTPFLYDTSGLYVPLLERCPPFCRSYSAVGLASVADTEKFTQEVRLAAREANALEWVIGGFYTHEDSEGTQEFLPRDLAGLPAPNDLLTFSKLSRYEEYAAFGDLTWNLTDNFDVTGGVRYAQNNQNFEQAGSGLFGFSTPNRRSSDDVFTYLANARYHFSDHAIGYLRYATGYRPGGPNFVTVDAVTGLPVGPPTFEADRLKSYEIGFKAETADRRFGIDIAGYYLDWSNIQISVVRGGFAAIDNAPHGASVRGAELNLTARPTSAFTVLGAFAYQDSEMSESESALGAVKGEQLPNSPRFTAALNVDYALPMGNWQPTVGATLRYVDDRMASFDNRSIRQYRLPDYTTVDLRTGMTFDRVNVHFYVRNLFDERGQLSAFTVYDTARISILQPRTIGVTASIKLF